MCIESLMVFAGALNSAAESGAAAPPQIITVPLPQGQKMEFALVRVSDEANIFSSYEFEMGESADSGFPVKSVPTRVSGSVFVHDSYWAIPIGRTEVTRAQYAAVMTPHEMPAAAEEKLPQTNISKLDMLKFIEKLNIWLQTDEKARQVMAGIGSAESHGIPYVTLPHESEWEFVARGGAHVERTQFMDSIPYEDEASMAEAENLASQRGGKMKNVASSNKPNPAGVYDMFGNVEEMVQDTFRPEYTFGRIGAHVVRGGSYITTLDKATSFIRREVPVFNSKKPEPYKSNLLGFRLSMGSVILASSLVGKIDEVWDEHAEAHTVITPGDSASRSTADNLAQSENRLEKNLELITAQLAKNPESAKAMAKIASLETILNEMKMKIEAADRISTKAAIELIYNSSYSSFSTAYNRVLNDVAWVLSQGKNKEEFARLHKLNNELTLTINGDKTNVILGCETLLNVGEDTMNAAFAERLAIIESKQGKDGQNSRLIHIAKEVACKAKASGRISDELLKSWLLSIDNMAWETYTQKAAAKGFKPIEIQAVRDKVEALKTNPTFVPLRAAASSPGKRARR